MDERLLRIDVPNLKNTEVYYDPLVEALVFKYLAGFDVNSVKQSFTAPAIMREQGKPVVRTAIDATEGLQWPSGITKVERTAAQTKMLPITFVGNVGYLKLAIGAASWVLRDFQVDYVDTYQQFLAKYAKKET